MVLIQSESISTQVMLPTTLAPIAPVPSSTASIMASACSQSLPVITVFSPAVSSVTALPVVCSTVTPSSVALAPVTASNMLPFVSVPELVDKMPVVNVASNASPFVAESGNESQPSNSKSSPVKNGSSALPEKKQSSELSYTKSKSALRSDDKSSGNKNACTHDIDDTSFDKNRSKETVLGFMSVDHPISEDLEEVPTDSVCDFRSVDNPVPENLDEVETDNASEKMVTLEECIINSLETPQKSPPPSDQNIATPNLHMPSLLSTPENISLNGVKNLSASLIDDPLVSFQPSQKANGGLSLSPESEESNGVDLKGGYYQSKLVSNPPKSVAKGSGVMSSKSDMESRGDQNSSSSHQSETTENESEKKRNSLPVIPGLFHVSDSTLVTSVYQSPISSSGVTGVETIRLMMNVSPQKTSPYRKISPRKILRSPIKTSPMKKVSPILRKYGYRKKMRPTTKKLSPILPKITVNVY